MEHNNTRPCPTKPISYFRHLPALSQPPPRPCPVPATPLPPANRRSSPQSGLAWLAIDPEAQHLRPLINAPRASTQTLYGPANCARSTSATNEFLFCTRVRAGGKQAEGMDDGSPAAPPRAFDRILRGRRFCSSQCRQTGVVDVVARVQDEDLGRQGVGVS